MKTLFQNRQARFDYAIEASHTAGVLLEGWEVKSLLNSQATFNAGNAFVRFKDGEAWLEAFTIQPMASTAKGLLVERQPLRSRKLLLTRHELDKLQAKVAISGYTVVPLEITYDRRIHVVIGVGKGKKKHDKRDTIKQREQSRDLQRQLKAL
ncbi:SsrA-binding protein SmpB [Comamonas thiooxydans]|uniref:SsrA-binding protein SmpB n=1 Tax=Comamonas thiooxydans TaxID=363952 RepID=UPI000B420089|nr:SsrA-binding protein SmpB [Comamonas thiooxydans]